MVHFHNEIGKPSKTLVISMLTCMRLRWSIRGCGFLVRSFCLRWLAAAGGAADGWAEVQGTGDEIPCVSLSACGPLEAERKGHGLCLLQLCSPCSPSSRPPQRHRAVREEHLLPWALVFDTQTGTWAWPSTRKCYRIPDHYHTVCCVLDAGRLVFLAGFFSCFTMQQFLLVTNIAMCNQH